MTAAKLSRFAAIEQPFPGLRPFEPPDAFLFFGREQHTQELLERLSRNRFLAVVGTSGSGKSSLVRAGLLPALYRGYLVGATSRWRIAVMRPGSAPLDELAKALADTTALGSDAAQVRERVGASSLGLVQAVQDGKLAEGESLLLLVDQFEELFRFASESRSSDAPGEAQLFVSSLVEAVDQYSVPIYIVLTMRTDFLGDCTRFPGLPEALNRSQYLIPRLSREERRDANERPIEIAGSEITPRLVQQLLNDLGDDPDQLPVMQHALSRTYRLWKEKDNHTPLDLDDYTDAGAMAEALDHHAQGIYDRFSPEDRVWTSKLFRSLTKMDKGREVRRPGRLGRLFEVVGANDDAGREAVKRVIGVYASSENSLLLVSPAVNPEDAVVDISHESLIRKWHLLSKWVKEESESVEWYADLARDTLRHAKGDASYWMNPELSRALERRSKDGWTSAWAEQYRGSAPPDFDAVQRFLAASTREQQKRVVKRIMVYLLAVVFLLSCFVAAGEYYASQRAKQATKETEVRLGKTTAQLDQTKLALKDATTGVASKERELDHQKELLQQAANSSEADRRKIQANIDQLNGSLVESQKKENDALKSQLATLATNSKSQDARIQQLQQLSNELTQTIQRQRKDIEVGAYAKQEAKPSPAPEQQQPTAQEKQPAVDKTAVDKTVASADAPAKAVSVAVAKLSTKFVPEVGITVLLGDLSYFNRKTNVYLIAGSPPKVDLESVQEAVSGATGEKTYNGYQVWSFKADGDNYKKTPLLGAFKIGGRAYQLFLRQWTIYKAKSESLTLEFRPL